MPGRNNTSAYDEKWMAQYEKLVAYKQKHGSTLGTLSADKSLGRWVYNQRKFQKTGTLRDDRKDLLNTIGFVWKGEEQYERTPWLDQYEKLVAYKQKHGHTRVPRCYSEDKSFGLWVCTQRALNKKDKLRKDRKVLLNDIAFEWTLSRGRGRKECEDGNWLNQYEKLVAYREKHGHTRVPQHYSEDKSFGAWVINQRALNKKDKLREDRKVLLNGILFEWTVMKDRDSWEDQYQKLVTYKESNGHTRVPRNYSEDKSLGAWVSNQRYLNKKGMLQPERRELLNQIGFTWQMHMSSATDEKTNQSDSTEDARNDGVDNDESSYFRHTVPTQQSTADSEQNGASNQSAACRKYLRNIGFADCLVPASIFCSSSSTGTTGTKRNTSTRDDLGGLDQQGMRKERKIGPR